VELGGDHLEGFAAEGAARDEDAGGEEDGACEEESELSTEPDGLREGGVGAWAGGRVCRSSCRCS